LLCLCIGTALAKIYAVLIHKPLFLI
jgi:hypothetical protein